MKTKMVERFGFLSDKGPTEPLITSGDRFFLDKYSSMFVYLVIKGT